MDGPQRFQPLALESLSDNPPHGPPSRSDAAIQHPPTLLLSVSPLLLLLLVMAGNILHWTVPPLLVQSAHRNPHIDSMSCYTQILPPTIVSDIYRLLPPPSAWFDLPMSTYSVG